MTLDSFVERERKIMRELFEKQWYDYLLKKEENKK